MTRFGWIVLLCLLAGVGALAGAAYYWTHRADPAADASSNATSTPPDLNPSELAIYTSGEYGFSFFYPAQARVMDAYTASRSPSLPWRVQAIGTGTPIVAILAGNDEARVGVSEDPRELAACAKPGPAETAGAPVAVASTTWRQFTFDKLGTDDERRVTSYRVVRGARCYAVEVLSPIDAPAAAATSTSYTIRDLIMSFSFAS